MPNLDNEVRPWEDNLALALVAYLCSGQLIFVVGYF